MHSFSNLPQETLAIILSYLNLTDVLNLRLLSSDLLDKVDGNEQYWKEMIGASFVHVRHYDRRFRPCKLKNCKRSDHYYESPVRTLPVGGGERSDFLAFMEHHSRANMTLAEYRQVDFDGLREKVFATKVYCETMLRTLWNINQELGLIKKKFSRVKKNDEYFVERSLLLNNNKKRKLF